MGKTRSEIQKDYRERKKKELGKAYLEKESARVLKYYKPSYELTKQELKKRRNKNRKAVQKCRTEKALAQAAEAQNPDDQQSVLSLDSGIGDPSDSSTPLVVRMPFNQGRRNAPRRKRSRALAIAHKKIALLEKKVKRTQKRLERVNKERCQQEGPPVTPNSKTMAEIEEVSRTGNTETIKRKLLLGNSILQDVRSTKGKRNGKLPVIRGQVLKKYGLLRWFSQETGVCRRSIVRQKTKTPYNSKLRREMLRIQSFLKREDNSRMLPGKKDATKDGNGEKKQVMILSDYLANLHRKYLAENPSYTISLASFSRARPKNVRLVKFASRNICLCQYHQNMALMLKAINSAGLTISRNPEEVIQTLKSENEIRETLKALPSEIIYPTWQKVNAGTPSNPTLKKLKQVDVRSTREEFIEHFIESVASFRTHVHRMQEQFSQHQILKGCLPRDDIMVQMDFAQNYACRSLDEIQSAYWTQTGVTLHPIVVHFYEDGIEKLQHKSFVVVSNEMSHSSNTVLTILEKLIPELKILKPGVQLLDG